MIKSIFIFICQALLIVFLIFLAREAWRSYQEENLNIVFDRHSIPVTVNVDDVTHEKLIWKDYIGNSKYLSFTYHGKQYGIRYLQDSGWVEAGSNTRLLYNDSLDLFRQPAMLRHTAPNYRSSKLVSWSVLGLISYAGRWLFGFILLSAVIFLLVSSILANITKWDSLRLISRMLARLLLFAGVLYVTYDTFTNYRYYRRIKSNGQLIEKTVLDKERNIYGRQDNTGFTNLYYYTAAVNDPGGEIHIPISKSEYEQLEKGSSIQVLSDDQLDDMMSVGYSIEYWKWVFTLLVWILFGYAVIKMLRKNNNK